MNSKELEFLSVPLPEEIAALKYYGDLEGAERLSNKMMQDAPKALKKRLELEKEILRIIPRQYPYSFHEALEMLQKKVSDFREEELVALQESGDADWVFIQGQPFFQERFLMSLIKTKPDLAKRLLETDSLEAQEEKDELRIQNIRIMKETGSRSFRIRLRTGIRLAEHAIREGQCLRVHLPLPILATQTKNIRILNTTPKAKSLGSETDLQRTAYFEEIVNHDNSSFFVEFEFENHMDYVKLDPAKASPVQPTFDLEEQEPHIRFTPYLRRLQEEIVKGEKNPVIIARRIYDFITTHIRYTFMREYFTVDNITEYAAANLKGDCGVQALLFITLCRMSGIPARWQSGCYITPDVVSNHDWAQFYIAPYGWRFADCSFGGSAIRKGDRERWEFYFGNLDPFRMPANSAFQKDFIPVKKQLRIDPYDNQRGEAEYEDYGLKGEDFVVDRTVLEMKEI